MIYPSAMRANSSMGPTFFVVGKSKGADVPFHEGSDFRPHWPIGRLLPERFILDLSSDIGDEISPLKNE